MKLTNKEKIELELLSNDLDIDITGISFQKVWIPTRANALFFILMSNTMFLDKKVLKKHGIWDLIDEVAHELVHREQFKRDGFFLYLAKKVFYRLLGWLTGGNSYEIEAYKRQDIIDELKRRT